MQNTSQTLYNTRELNVSVRMNNVSHMYPDDLTPTEQHLALRVFKGIAMTSVIIATLFGNVMVITAVSRFKHLRSLHNYYIVSLAIADLLVGTLVQPFNMYNEMSQGEWSFGHEVCDLFNANDVFFTTASLLHLCCISCDRYIAILHPFVYERVITKRKVIIMISASWLLSALLSYIPIFNGWYTTAKVLEQLLSDPAICKFEVSVPYAFISSSISFWIPCTVMVILYHKILQVARKQEKQIQSIKFKSEDSNSSLQLSSHSSSAELNENEKRMRAKLTAPQHKASLTTAINSALRKDEKQAKKMRKEHRAAKTLGLIMGMYILCMGPIFLWYTTTFGICPETCSLPEQYSWVITLVFWIGYMNSCINPIIYAFFNRDFKVAFKRLFRGCIRYKNSKTRNSSLTSEGPLTPQQSQRRTNQQKLMTVKYGAFDQDSDETPTTAV